MADDDAIKPVSKASAVYSRLHADPSLQVPPGKRDRKQPPAKRAESDGLTLQDITAEKAAIMLTLPIMDDEAALGIKQFGYFKAALQKTVALARDPSATPLDDLEYGALKCADQVLDLLHEKVPSSLISPLENQMVASGRNKPVIRG